METMQGSSPGCVYNWCKSLSSVSTSSDEFTPVEEDEKNSSSDSSSEGTVCLNMDKYSDTFNGISKFIYVTHFKSSKLEDTKHITNKPHCAV